MKSGDRGGIGISGGHEANRSGDGVSDRHKLFQLGLEDFGEQLDAVLSPELATAG